MRNAHKVLIIALAYASLLLPKRIFPDNDRSYPLFCQKVHNALTGCMQVMMNLSIARVGDAFHLSGDALSIIFRKLVLEFLHALIIPLVPRFDRTTVNQARDKALSV